MAWCGDSSMASHCFHMIFLISVCSTLHALEDWRPQIVGSYCTSSGVVVVRISPPMSGAYDYYVCAENKDDSSIFIDTFTQVNKSDKELVYKLTGIPSVQAQYIILVRARDKHGDALSPFKPSADPVFVPPVGPPKESGPGFHIEKWVIIIGGIIVFFFIVFIVVMLYVGRGCRASRRRHSVRSHTSQMTTSETMCSSAEAQPFTSPPPRAPSPLLTSPPYALTDLPLIRPESGFAEDSGAEAEREGETPANEGSLDNTSLEIEA